MVTAQAAQPKPDWFHASSITGISNTSLSCLFSVCVSTVTV